METYVQSLRRGLHEAMQADERIHLIGEDILDPYGGAFKVEKGLSSAFPSRVHTAPISEAGFTGLATGMALRGLRPIVSIMFGDFLALAFDQILNHMVKFSTMYGREIDVPVLIRTPMGGRRGYGATHSQTIEKYFVGVPGLAVVAPSHAHDAGAMIRDIALHGRGPTLFIENKSLYPLPHYTGSAKTEVAPYAGNDGTLIVRNFTSGTADATIVAYGGIAALILPLLEEYADEEINLSLVLPARISPLNLNPILDEVRASGLVLVVEEGTEGYSWGSEVAASITDHVFRDLKAPVKRVASKAAVIPCSETGEKGVLVGRPQIEAALLDLIG
jgi:pyruvate/2-oxoglutarate/acetoin dehydrogenase E1 component